MTDPHMPPLILLAGTSESGKSTAGSYLAGLGAERIKIRTILLALTSGVEVEHEGVATREHFDWAEFNAALAARVSDTTRPVVVVESFIHVGHARIVKNAWGGPAFIVFITADFSSRIQRLSALTGVTATEAAATIQAKDASKRVTAQLDQWRGTADYWIDNDMDLSHYQQTLADLYAAVVQPTTKE